MSNGNASELARALQEVTQTAQLLVREEIALARAEVSEKASKLIRGAVVGAVAGVFLLAFLVFLLHAIAWGIWSLISDSAGSIWAGFAILAGLLLLLAVVAGLVAARFVRRGVPPTPQMAIEEAQLIRQTVAAAQAERETVTPIVRGGDELSSTVGESAAGGSRRAGS